MLKNARAQSILLHEEDAIAIYLAKIQNKPRDLAAKLANRYRISTKVVRDIWSLRTWVRATRPSRTRLTSNFTSRIGCVQSAYGTTSILWMPPARVVYLGLTVQKGSSKAPATAPVPRKSLKEGRLGLS